jgi:putative CocE/NonD family hydrolase
MSRWRWHLLLFLLFSLSSTAGLGQTSQQSHAQDDISKAFEKRITVIPMRDGVRLHTTIFVPKNARGPLPLLLDRTPYGYAFEARPGAFGALVDDGYIFVFQDIRGRHGSEGQFMMLRPPRDKRVPNAIDESTDAYDTIEWLVKNVPNNNGRVGMLGISYDAWLTVMAMLDPHPALKAVSEQASPADEFLGDDFHHNGAFRLSYGFEYPAMVEGATQLILPKFEKYFDFDPYDTYEWYLRLGPLANANKRYFHGNLPTWNNFVSHPNYDDFWQKQAVTPYLDQPKVPNLNVAG